MTTESSVKIPGFSLKNFDFSAYAERSRANGESQSDGSAQVVMKGRKRKATRYALYLTGFMRRSAKDFKTVAIGSNKARRGGHVILVFDNKELPSFDVTINETNKQVVVNNKALTLKVLEEFGIEAPTREDTSLHFLFSLEPVEGCPNIYVITPERHMFTDAAGTSTTKQYKK
jgi:hypothetical protein